MISEARNRFRAWPAAIGAVAMVALLIGGLVTATQDRGSDSSSAPATNAASDAAALDSADVDGLATTQGGVGSMPVNVESAAESQQPVPTMAQDESVEVRKELAADVTASLEVDLDVANGSLARFSPIGTGQLVVVDAQSGSVDVVDANGLTNQFVISISRDAGELLDAAVGPDGVLYVSQVGEYDQDLGEGLPYTTTAYRLSEIDVIDPAQEWTSLWACGGCEMDVISSAGVLQADGSAVPFIDPVRNYPAVSTLEVEALAPTDDGGDCSESASPSRMMVENEGETWDVEVPCPATTMTSGTVDTEFQPQSDGSVVALVPFDDGGSSVLWLRPGGSVASADVSEMSITDVAVVDGQLMAVAESNGSVELVEIKF